MISCFKLEKKFRKEISYGESESESTKWPTRDALATQKEFQRKDQQESPVFFLLNIRFPKKNAWWSSQKKDAKLHTSPTLQIYEYSTSVGRIKWYQWRTSSLVKPLRIDFCTLGDATWIKHQDPCQVQRSRYFILYLNLEMTSRISSILLWILSFHEFAVFVDVWLGYNWRWQSTVPWETISGRVFKWITSSLPW